MPLLLILLVFFASQIVLLGANNENHHPLGPHSNINFVPLEEIFSVNGAENPWVTEFITGSRNSTTMDYEVVDGVKTDKLIEIPRIPKEEVYAARYNIEGESYGSQKQLVLRMFKHRTDTSIYIQRQDADEDYFYQSAHHFSDAFVLGFLKVFKADLNQDGKSDYILMKNYNGNGLAAGNTDVGFLISGKYSIYKFHVLHSMFPDKSDFVYIDGKPYFLHCNGDWADSKDGRNFYWVYNLVSFGEGSVELSNDSRDDFPRTIWYSYKPRHNETKRLGPKSKAQLVKSCLPIINKKEHELPMEWRPGIDMIKATFNSRQKSEIIKYLDPPIYLEWPFSIETVDQLDKYYDWVFDDEFYDKILNSTYKDWYQAGWRGVFMKGGIIQDGDPSYYGFHIYNLTEKGKLGIKELKNIFRDRIHESAKDYERNLIDAKSHKYRIRADRLADKTYRLSIWHVEQNISEEPYKTIQNGTWESRGSGGYDLGLFNDDGTIYEFDDNAKFGYRFKIYYDFGEGIVDSNHILYCDEVEPVTQNLDDYNIIME